MSMVPQETIDLVEEYFGFKINEHGEGLQNEGTSVTIPLKKAIVGINTEGFKFSVAKN